ncbi:MAG TPA: omptin family outer membrane protease [Spirochaetia bacterium]|nr:omptin family outer membrane protease [Spirochaetia bacterium]
MPSSGRAGVWLVVFLALTGVLPVPSAAAQGAEVTAGTRVGIMYGTAKEFVLDFGFPISELDWPCQPLFFQESTLDVRALGGLHGFFQVQVGIPSYSGTMTDSDWLNYPSGPNPTSKTHFSESNAFTERSVTIDARLGWEFRVANGISFEPFAAFSFMSWQWSGRDGYSQYPASGPPYPVWSPSLPQKPFYGTVGMYQQVYIIPGVGMRLGFRFGERWTVAATAVFSPLVSCYSLDTHVLRDIDITSHLSGGMMIEPGVELQVLISDKMSLGGGAVYRHISGLVGDEVVLGGPNALSPDPAPGTQVTYPSSSGASFDMVSGWLSFSISL